MNIVKYTTGPDSKKAAMSIQSANFKRLTPSKKNDMAKIEWTIRGAELVESSIKQKLVCFLKVEVKEEKNLYNLVDIAVEIDSLKWDEQFSSLFASYDSSAGASFIVS